MSKTMAYHLPHKEHIGSKWLTVTLVSLYIIIAALAFIYNMDGTNSKGNAPKNNFSGESYTHDNALSGIR
jgi:hypothetical protein